MDSIGANLEDPRRVRGRLYHRAKFGNNRCSSLENMECSIFGVNGWKCLFTPPNLVFWDYLTHKWGAIWTKPQKAHPCISPRRLSHQTRKSIDWFDLYVSFQKTGINK